MTSRRHVATAIHKTCKNFIGRPTALLAYNAIIISEMCQVGRKIPLSLNAAYNNASDYDSASLAVDRCIDYEDPHNVNMKMSGLRASSAETEYKSHGRCIINSLLFDRVDVLLTYTK